MRATIKKSVLFMTLAVAASLGEQCAFADQASSGAALAAPTSADDAWHYVVGAGVLSLPRYPGASDRRFEPIPVLGASYGPLFIGSVPGSDTPFEIGAFLYRDAHWKVAALLSYDFFSPRNVSDDPAQLHGLGDIARTAHTGLLVSYSQSFFTLRSAVNTDIGGKHEGTQISFDALGNYRLNDKLTFQGGPGITWGSSQYNQKFYGVTQAQSLSSGLASTAEGAGLNAVRLAGSATYHINRNWSVDAKISLTRLPGDVGNSPIVQKRAQVDYGLFVVGAF
jgi:outer membrane scaffolding protein for murein synthesis (MipA/OmpV family)